MAMQAKADFDLVGDIIAFESGDMSHEEIIALFQKLIDSGLAWQLQGRYGRTAQALINAGYCHSRAIKLNRV